MKSQPSVMYSEIEVTNWPAPKELGSHEEDLCHASFETGSGQSRLLQL